MKRSFTLKILFQVVSLFILTDAYAQAPKVPSKIKFGDVELSITDGAKEIIQKDVDNLVRHPKFFEVKLDRVNLYMPIIERVLKEEGLPADFKYLAIQESALVSDAVSSSNAVGFWQFKKETGLEVGMRIDEVVDERLNIVSSTRGAARYLKRNNFYFDNWVFTLLSYYLGRGGASNVLDKDLYGAKKLTLDESTNWYILRNLAHKIVFESLIGQNTAPEFRLVEYQDGARKSLKHIAKELGIEEELIREYNKWLKSNQIPEDRPYTVIAPVLTDEYRKLLAKNMITSQGGSANNLKKGTEIKYLRNEAHLIEVNNITAFVAREKDNIATITLKAGISRKKFYKYNELQDGAELETGQIYYLKNKKNKAKLYFHTVKEGESLWEISQKYGIKTIAILRKNRMSDESELEPRRILWLHKMRPAKLDPEYLPADEPETEEQEEELHEEEQIFTKQEEDMPEPETSGTEKVNELDLEDGKNVLVKNAEDNGDEGKEFEHEFVVEIEIEDEIFEEEGQAELVQATEEANDPAIEKEKDSSLLLQQDNDVKFVNTKGSEDKKAEEKAHVVQKGETLYSISRKYNISVSELIANNDLDIADGIKVGQQITLVHKAAQKVSEKEKAIEKEKAAEDQKDEYLFHTVTSGETLYKIAREYQVTIKDVMDWNKKEDFNVGIGEVLKIKKP